MKIEVLISTMYRSNLNFLDEINIQGDGVVVNQTDKALGDGPRSLTSGIIVVNSHDRGLSRSRNLAISKSNADICLLCDDDVIYRDGFRKIVENAYSSLPHADIIIFGASSTNESRGFSDLGNKVRRLKIPDLLKVSSVRVSFRREAIKKCEIVFNENFGSGSRVFISGEENIFLVNAARKGLKIFYWPEVILTKSFTNSLWFKGYNKEYFESKGAFGYELFGQFYLIYAMYFVITKFALYSDEISLFKAFGFMRSGRARLKQLSS